MVWIYCVARACIWLPGASLSRMTRYDMTRHSAKAGRRAAAALAAVAAVAAAGLLPALVVGALLAIPGIGRDLHTAMNGAGLMFLLGACGALGVLLPMALVLDSSARLRWYWVALVGAVLGALAMAICDWPGGRDGALLARLRYVDAFDWVRYGISVLIAAGFGLLAGLGFHGVFRSVLAGGRRH